MEVEYTRGKRISKEKMSKGETRCTEVVTKGGTGGYQEIPVRYTTYSGKTKWTPPMPRRKQYGPWKKQRETDKNFKKKDSFATQLCK
mmetsp:Transcript_115495/g.172569  ORF Transcript_115495/g.172569 Transcript_115495/m.172569 type:complete len:87 (-) Transcript_115495:16-276(-)